MRSSILLFFVCLSISYYSYSHTNPDSLLKANKVVKETIHEGSRLAGERVYDSNSNLISHYYSNFTPEGITTSSISKYNSENKIIFVKSTHSSLSDTTYRVYQYDEQGNKIAVIDGSNNKVIFKYEYDSGGRIVRQVYLDSSGNEGSVETYKYDEFGNEVEQVIYNGDAPPRINKTYYDSKNREIKSESLNDGKVRFSTYKVYDNKNNLVKVLYDSGGSKYGDKYVFDKRNRISQKIHFRLEDDEEVTTGLEEFSYYDNGLLKEYSEDIFSFARKRRTFTFTYKQS